MVRIKERYLLVNILYPSEIGSRPDIPDVVVINQPTTDELTPVALMRGIRAEVAAFFGDHGSGAIEGAAFSVKYSSPATSTFIIRTSRASYRYVWTALTFMDIVPVKHGKPCTFQVVHVSGTIRKAEEEAIRRARNLIFAAQNGQSQRSADPLANMFGSSKRPTHEGAGADRFDVDDEESDVEMGEVSDG
ncbi:Uu.00g020140.m01.CDS01 [Anthostomella pinea]|uniref:Uu.00g020140.m01.CDS01 n=1 Tax=Anthostomella pinea TaxID=933095 RepID=A0AAI8YQT6_9PEZI|nr:Uu.00g020140.m01.CDS01 [Anthostomella pinea]